MEPRIIRISLTINHLLTSELAVLRHPFHCGLAANSLSHNILPEILGAKSRNIFPISKNASKESASIKESIQILRNNLDNIGTQIRELQSCVKESREIMKDLLIKLNRESIGEKTWRFVAIVFLVLCLTLIIIQTCPF